MMEDTLKSMFKAFTKTLETQLKQNHEDLSGQLNLLTSRIDNLATQVDTLNEQQRIASEKQEVFNSVLLEMTSSYYDAYDVISNSSNNSGGSKESIRKSFLNSFEGALDLRMGIKYVWCSVAGYQPEKHVKLAHICPRSSNLAIQRLLSMDNDARCGLKNLILLSRGIEHFFDRKQLSFVQKDAITSQLVMKICDDSIRDQPIHKESNIKIGELDGSPLQLLPKHEPYRRCFAYQELCAFIDQFRLRKCKLDSFKGSVLDDGPAFVDYRERIIKELKHLKNLRNREIEAEEDIDAVGVGNKDDACSELKVVS